MKQRPLKVITILVGLGCLMAGTMAATLIGAATNAALDKRKLNDVSSLTGTPTFVSPTTTATKAVVVTPDQLTGLALYAPYRNAWVNTWWVTNAWRGAGNFGGNLDCLEYALPFRIRQNGTIQQVRFWLPTTNNLVEYTVKIWRQVQNDDYFGYPWFWQLVGQSENLTDHVLAAGTNTVTLTSPIADVQVGDYYGVRFNGDASGLQTNLSWVGHILSTSGDAASGFDWKNLSNGHYYSLWVELYGDRPDIVAIGDSTTAGGKAYPTYWWGYSEYTLDTNSWIVSARSDWPAVAGRELGLTWQNLGMGGERISPVLTNNPTTNPPYDFIGRRFAEDIITNTHPRYVVIGGGVNDIGVTDNTAVVSLVVASYSNCTAAAAAAGIVPILLGIMPVSGLQWPGTNSAKHLAADNVNAALPALAALYGGVCVNSQMLAAVGQERVGGPAGNRWDWRPGMSGDGLHPSETARVAIADMVVQALLDLGAASVNKGVAATNAAAQIGDVAVVVAGDPVCFRIGATNPNGGEVTCLWNFGDGSTSSECNPCHVYTNCASYTVGATITYGIASSRATVNVAVACAMSVTNFYAKLNFAKVGMDSCQLKMLLHIGQYTNWHGTTVTLDVGGVQTSWTLDKKGRSLSPDCKCRFAHNKRTGLCTMTVRLKRGSWAGLWANYGLVNDSIAKPGVAVKLPVILVIGDEAFMAEKPLHYNSKAGKYGEAK